jgi:hypothetical protein
MKNTVPNIGFFNSVQIILFLHILFAPIMLQAQSITPVDTVIDIKKFIFLFLFVICFVALFSQDIIITIENDSISAKVLKVYNTTVRYVPFNDQDGLSYFIAKTMIASITYENGEIEIFEDSKNVTDKAKTIVVIKPEIIREQKKSFPNVLTINPLAIVLSAALYQYFELDLKFSRYVHPNIALPLEFGLFLGGDIGVGFAFLTGVEVVPLTHQQKSGLLLNALVGICGYENNNRYGFMDRKVNIGTIVNANGGYQLMTKNGFIINATVGAMYSSTARKLAPRFALNIGVAF